MKVVRSEGVGQEHALLVEEPRADVHVEHVPLVVQPRNDLIDVVETWRNRRNPGRSLSRIGGPCNGLYRVSGAESARTADILSPQGFPYCPTRSLRV
jgi:hypothetical protein